MFSNLMTTERFAPVFWCQFFSALNDNFVKNALVILILYRMAGEGGASLVTLAGAALIAPFFLLSGLGGELADRYDKTVVARKIKLAELPVALVAATGFYFLSIPILFAALILYGCGAALFGPIKYGILPIHLEQRELAAGNALVEGATFLAILVGTIVGGHAATSDGASWLLPAVVIVLAGLGLTAARMMPPTGQAAPNLKINTNLLSSTLSLLSDLKAHPRLWQGGLITSWFWLVGAVSLSLLPTMMKEVVGGQESVVTAGLLVFTIGIAVGSTIAAFLSRGRPNLALVPIGAVLMSVFSLDLAYLVATLAPSTPPIDAWTFAATWAGGRMLFDLAGLATAGGLFIVPAFAAVQAWAPVERKSRVVAGCNVLNALFMTVASLAVAGLQSMGTELSLFWLAIGLANAVATALIIYVWRREIANQQNTSSQISQ